MNTQLIQIILFLPVILIIIIRLYLNRSLTKDQKNTIHAKQKENYKLLLKSIVAYSLVFLLYINGINYINHKLQVVAYLALMSIFTVSSIYSHKKYTSYNLDKKQNTLQIIISILAILFVGNLFFLTTFYN